MKKQNQLKAMVFAAVLAAMSVALGICSIRVGEVYKIGFSKLPVVLSSVVLGPIWGALVGVVGDIVAAIMNPYGYNPLISLPALFVGALPWCFVKLFGGKKNMFPIVAATVITRVLISGFLLTIILGYAYDMFDLIEEFLLMLVIRIAIALGESILEGFVIYFLINLKPINNIIKKNEIEYDT